MDSLRPCPFCGGEAKRSSETFERTILSWVYCPNCGAAGGYRHTEAEAIEAWNTRYHSEFEETVIKAWKEIKDYQERTCRVEMNDENDAAVCSQCGSSTLIRDIAELKNWGGDVEIMKFITYPYCPNFGAKVVGE